MGKELYARYNEYYPVEIITSGLQDVESLMESIDNRSYTVPRTYEKIYQIQEDLDAVYY
ncbi:MAG: hypothetical protein GX097_03750 [Methanomicrobiales archaeon]|jgi:hypothetical protein|nr:hypothetical protein [Methanomicrobiales archaeon]